MKRNPQQTTVVAFTTCRSEPSKLNLVLCFPPSLLNPGTRGPQPLLQGPFPYQVAGLRYMLARDNRRVKGPMLVVAISISQFLSTNHSVVELLIAGVATTRHVSQLTETPNQGTQI